MDDIPVSFASNVMSLVSSFRSLAGPMSPTKAINGSANGAQAVGEESVYAEQYVVFITKQQTLLSAGLDLWRLQLCC